MLTHKQSGFRAAIALRELPSPPQTPQSDADSPAAAEKAPPAPASLEMIRTLPEYAPAALPDGKLLSYVEASEEAFRVFFWRDAAVQPVVGLEAYAAFLYIPDEQPWCKVFAAGLGVASIPGLDWYIDGDLGPAAPRLADTPDRCVTLKLYRCSLKANADLNFGYIKAADVAQVDESAPVAAFAWLYGSRLQLEALGVYPRTVLSRSGVAANPLGGDSGRPAEPKNELEPALDLLRLSNSILVSLLTADQKKRFVELLRASQGAQRVLAPVQLRQLEQLSGKGTAHRQATSIDNGAENKENQAGGASVAGRVAGRKRKAALSPANQPRRTRTASGLLEHNA